MCESRNSVVAYIDSIRNRISILSSRDAFFLVEPVEPAKIGHSTSHSYCIHRCFIDHAQDEAVLVFVDRRKHTEAIGC